MTGRERVLNAFYRVKSDRIPTDYSGNGVIDEKLRKHFKAKDNYELLDCLGTDLRPLYAPYKGRLLFKEKPGRNVDPVYGFYVRWVENQSGGYWDFCDYPLKSADEEIIRNFPVPDPDDFDYDAAGSLLSRFEGRAVYVGNAGQADIINSTGRVMGMEDTLVNLQIEDEATLSYIKRRCDMELKVLERLIEKYRAKVDFLWMGEDLGTQIAPMIGLEMYRKVLKPFHKLYIDLAKSYNLPVMIHTCGSSSWVYEDFIEMGVGAVDTLQPEAVNMSPAFLMEKFGKRLSFHGCISTAGALAYGTAEQVRSIVADTIEIMKPGCGYMLAPTHMVQDNTPLENVLAMFEAAKTYGSY